MPKPRNLQEQYDKMREEILAHPHVQQLIKDHAGEITRTVIEKNLMRLYEYISQERNCEQCKGLHHCANLMQGYKPILVFRRGSIELDYYPCEHKKIQDEKKKAETLIQSIYVPKDVLNATFQSIDLDHPSRLEAVRLATKFVDTFKKEPQKGLYIYGPFGVGKSYLLGAIANELAAINVSSFIVYFPEFIREMKQSLGDHSINEKLDTVKKAPVLMIDDIGAESMSSWMRDDILGTILQYRMLEGLSTFFTSNFDWSELEYHLTYSQRGEEEKMKSARVMERIKYLSTPVKLEGTNRRRK